LIAYDEDINFTITLKRNNGMKVDEHTVVSVIIMTVNRTRICNYEMPIGHLLDSELKLHFSYNSSVLLPNKYMIRVVTHVPNVEFYDRQDNCTFKISDDGTEFLKVNGAGEGLIVYNPTVNIIH
jgi:hypothetical protein